jgi:hypothetical protein
MTTKHIDTGGAAFPMLGEGHWADPEQCKQWVPQTGMTLRDYFAAHILPSLWDEAAAALREGYMGDPAKMSEIAKDAYRFADAMLAERAKGGA